MDCYQLVGEDFLFWGPPGDWDGKRQREDVSNEVQAISSELLFTVCFACYSISTAQPGIIIIPHFSCIHQLTQLTHE